VLLVVLLLSCGGTTTDSPGPAAGEAPVGGAGGEASECSGGAADGGCNGRGGEAALEAYARLHTACSLTLRVNRRGKPVCIDYHLE